MIVDIFYPIFTLTIIVLACFIRKKKLFGGFAPTPSPRHRAGPPGWLTTPPRPPAAIVFGFTKNRCAHPQFELLQINAQELAMVF